MGRLFWKFFFAFWCALLSAGLGVWGIMTVYDGTRNATALAIGPRAAFMVDTAAAIVSHKDFNALGALLQDWQQFKPHLEPVFVVDPQGRELFGRPLPEALLDKARESASRPMAGATTELWFTAARVVHLSPDEPYLVFAAAQDAGGAVPSPASLPRPPGAPPPPLPLVAGLLASLAFSAFMAWHFAKPVRLLRWALGSVASGNLNTRVRPLMGDRRDEIADLSRDFDRMTEELQHHIAAQRRLLHDVSHEVRSPLARLQAAIGLARQDPSKIAATLDRIEREGQRLDKLVGEILTLARLEAGPDRGPGEPLDLADLLADVVADVTFEAQAAHKSLRVQTLEDCLLTGHAEPLHRAFENILRNAVAYSPPDGVVDVAMHREPAGDAGLQLRVTMCDQGPGVPEDELEAIFSPFYRARKKLPAAGAVTGTQASSAAPSAFPGAPNPVPVVGGFGLGLAIARRAVEAHGGTVRASNRPEGGLCVEVLLPLTSA